MAHPIYTNVPVYKDFLLSIPFSFVPGYIPLFAFQTVFWKNPTYVTKPKTKCNLTFVLLHILPMFHVGVMYPVKYKTPLSHLQFPVFQHKLSSFFHFPVLYNKHWFPLQGFVTAP